MDKPIPLDKPFFLYVGSIQPGKNILNMVEAFIRFNKSNTYNLLIVGKPTYNGNQILNLIKNKQSVYYLGFLSDDEVSYLYDNCISTILLSFCEGFGIPPLEGFYRNKPSLASNATSIPEVVGQAGVLVNPYDIDDIISGFDKILTHYNDFAKHCKKQIQKFDKNHSCEMWMKILRIKYHKIHRND